MAQQQPPPPADRRAEAIGAALAVGAAAAGTAGATAAAAGVPLLTAAMLAALTRLLVRWRYRSETIKHTLRVVVRVTRTATPDGSPPPRIPGPAETANARAARTFAAWFLERTAARVEAAYNAGAEPGVPEAAEERYVEQHLDAQQRRRKAARAVDDEAASRDDHVTATEGPDADGMGRRRRVILKWRAHPDDRVTPECRAADGAWFYADTPPVIGYPGMPHGGTCRCWPGHAGSLAEVARLPHVNEAVASVLAGEPDHRTHPEADTGEAGRRRAS